MAAISIMGGTFAVLPAYEADLYGPKYVQVGQTTFILPIFNLLTFQVQTLGHPRPIFACRYRLNPNWSNLATQLEEDVRVSSLTRSF